MKKKIWIQIGLSTEEHCSEGENNLMVFYAVEQIIKHFLGDQVSQKRNKQCFD